MIDLTQDPIDLTAALVDIESPSHKEENIADAVEHSLRAIPQVKCYRNGNTVVARTERGLGGRVILAGHIDTVPLAGNVPSTRGVNAEGEDTLFGCGTVDMKSGMAVYLHAFATLANSDQLVYDLTIICYEGEEVATEFNGLGHLQHDFPELLDGDVALLGEPSGGMIEAGCQGSIRVKVQASGVRAHSARAWLGSNAVHSLTPVMLRVADYAPREEVDIDGCVYREGLNIVRMSAGVANNTIPDDAWVFVNFRYAPDRGADQALEHVMAVLRGEASSGTDGLNVTTEFQGKTEVGDELGDVGEGISVIVDDIAGAAHPGLSQPVVQQLIAAVGGNFRAKYGWTDVARFGELGIPAVNFGPGDPGFAHKKDEQCPVEQISQVSEMLLGFLTRRV